MDETGVVNFIDLFINSLPTSSSKLGVNVHPQFFSKCYEVSQALTTQLIVP